MLDETESSLFIDLLLFSQNEPSFRIWNILLFFKYSLCIPVKSSYWSFIDIIDPEGPILLHLLTDNVKFFLTLPLPEADEALFGFGVLI